MANCDTKIHHRRSIRLKGYDYSLAGVYFVTLVTKARVCLFGEIVGGEMRLSKYGKIVLNALEELPSHYKNIELSTYLIMPNHVHMIVAINDSGRGGSHEISNSTQSIGIVDRIVLPEDNKTRPYTKTPTTLSEESKGGSHEILNSTQSIGMVDRIVLPEDNKTRPYNKTPTTLSEVVRGFKSFSSRRINQTRQSTGTTVWQRNYYERIIRNQRELKTIYDYICANPNQWAEDEENPMTGATRHGAA